MARKSGSSVDVKKQILEAALLLLNSSDYHEVAMDRVAQKAGVAKGTVFLYFGSKEKLLKEVLLSMLEKIESLLITALSEEKVSSLDRLKNLYDRYVDFTLKNSNILMTLRKELVRCGDIPRHHQKIISRQKEMSEKLSPLIEKLIKEGVLKKMPAATGIPTSEIILSMMMLFTGAVGHMVLMNKDNPHFEKMKDIFWEILTHGILAKGSKRL